MIIFGYVTLRDLNMSKISGVCLWSLRETLIAELVNNIERANIMYGVAC